MAECNKNDNSTARRVSPLRRTQGENSLVQCQNVNNQYESLVFIIFAAKQSLVEQWNYDITAVSYTHLTLPTIYSV